MSTQVILLERVENLGNMGDVVSVKPGFARNYLLPQSKALRASKANIAYFEAQKKHLEAENDKKRKEAEKQAKGLEGLTVALIRQASETGQLYGSVNARDIAEQIAEASKTDVPRSAVNMNQNFKTLGLFPVEVFMHPEVKVEVTINIARSQEEAKIQLETGKAMISDQDEAAAPAEEAIGADEAQLEEVLEEGALEAEKEKQAQEAQLAAEEAEKEAQRQADKEAKEAAEAQAKAEAEAAAEVEAGDQADEKADQAEDSDKDAS